MDRKASMERSSFSGTGIRAMTLLVLVATITVAPNAMAQNNRNILFISVDDMRNWAGYSGEYAGTIHTPNIDALAAESTRFLKAYTTVPSCTASRTAVMLGLSPETTGLMGFSWGPTDPIYDALFSDPNIKSIPEVMTDNGYFSAASGKVFHSPFPDKWDLQGPLTDFTALLEGYFPSPDGTNFNPGVWPEGETHVDQVLADWAADFVDTYDGTKPFFLALDFFQPHNPWRAPQWAYDMYPLEDVIAPSAIPGDLDDVPAIGVDLALRPYMPGSSLTQYEAVEAAGKAQEYTRAYLAALTHTDAVIGTVLNALANSAHAGNTDVILWSDHGYHLGEKFHWKKKTLWEQSLRVPLLVKSPNNPNYPVGDVSRNVSTLDLAPTVVDLAGLPPESQFDGKPLHIDDGENKVYAYWEGARAVMAGGFKIINYEQWGTPDLDDVSVYYLAYDKQEQHNIFIPFLTLVLKAQAAQEAAGN